VVLALSVKQPWAALLVHGRKTIEVRRWSTQRRGRILIHAGRIPDPRPEGWAHVTADLESATQLRGGIVGEATLLECQTYQSRRAFTAERGAHLNRPHWFQEPALYGFVFANARPLPFRHCPGALYFFEVNEAPPMPEVKPSGLLVSVRSVVEAGAAMAGGADLIDVKEPGRGPLGRADDGVIAEVVRTVAGQRPVSAALGELAELRDLSLPAGLDYVKCGLAGMNPGKRRRRALATLRERLAREQPAPIVVTVAYADWRKARAPAWADVAEEALSQPGGVLLVDTYDKSPTLSGPRSLLEWLSLEEIRLLCQRCHAAGVRLALAGSLRMPHLLKLLDCRPTWFAVRGAVCESNQRDGAVHVLKVRALAELLRWKQAAPAGG
jgi:uncharacterized protein (UPF0264 family)